MMMLVLQKLIFLSLSLSIQKMHGGAAALVLDGACYIEWNIRIIRP